MTASSAPERSGRLPRPRSQRPSSALALWYSAHESQILGALSVAAVLAAWEAAVQSGSANPILMSSPSRIASGFWVLVRSAEFYEHLKVSGIELAIGFALSVIVGIPLGYAAALWRRAGYVIEPALAALYATPTIALVPLVIIWFGIGLWDKVVIVFLGAFLQIAISTLDGLRLVNPNYLKVARSVGANRRFLFRTVLVPSSIPFVLLGLRLGISRALVGVVVAEFFAATAGIGFMITVAGAHFQTATVFVGILFIALLGVVGSWLVGLLERRVERWRPKIGSA